MKKHRTDVLAQVPADGEPRHMFYELTVHDKRASAAERNVIYERVCEDARAIKYGRWWFPSHESAA
jgi:hypothetical protein